MKAESTVSRKDPSNVIRSFLPYFQIRSFVVRHKSGKIFSSQHGSTATCLLRVSFLKVVSTLIVLLETEMWSPQARDCICWSSLAWPMDFFEL